MRSKTLGRVPSPDDPRDWPIRSLLNVEEVNDAAPRVHTDRIVKRRLKRFDQADTNSCVGQSVGLVKRVQERRDLRRDVGIDPYAIWTKAKEDDGIGNPEENRGTYIRSALEALRVAAPGREGWNPRYRIAAYYRIRTVEEARAALFVTGPIVVGATWYRSWFDPQSVTGELPEPDEEVGGHAFVLYGYNDNFHGEGAFLAANSWGDEWGVRGDFLIPYRFFGDGQPVDEAWKLLDAVDVPVGG